MEDRETVALWLALLLVFTVPLWLPVMPLVARWRRARAARAAFVDTLPLVEFFTLALW